MIDATRLRTVVFQPDELELAKNVVRLRFKSVHPMGRSDREIVEDIYWGSVAELAVARYKSKLAVEDVLRRLMDDTQGWDEGIDFWDGALFDVKHQRTYLHSGLLNCIQSDRMFFRPKCRIRNDVTYIHTVSDPDQRDKALIIVGAVSGHILLNSGYQGVLWSELTPIDPTFARVREAIQE